MLGIIAVKLNAILFEEINKKNSFLIIQRLLNNFFYQTERACSVNVIVIFLISSNQERERKSIDKEDLFLNLIIQNLICPKNTKPTLNLEIFCCYR